MSGTRLIDEWIDICASPEAVWGALTHAEEIARWFAFTAEVSPGIGGRIDLRWGEAVRWPMVIRAWDPPRHVRLEDHYPREAVERETGRFELFVDFFIEPAGGGSTRVRVVHSGFAASALWDGLYDSTSCGWRCELGALKYYLERCPGAKRDWLWASRALKGPLDEAYATLLGPRGLGLVPRDAERREGAGRAAWRGGDAEPVTVVRAKVGRSVVVSPLEPTGVLMMAGVEPPQDPLGAACVMVRFNLYGGASSLKDGLKTVWDGRLGVLFG